MNVKRVEIVVGVCAVIISTCAMFISIWQAIEVRNFNRQGLMPNLQFERLIYKEHEKIGLKVANKGTGPAIIKRVILNYGDYFETNGTGQYAWFELNKQHNLIKNGIKLYWFEKDYILSPNDEVFIVWMNTEHIIDSQERHFNDFLNVFKMSIFYDSVYEDERVTHYKFQPLIK